MLDVFNFTTCTELVLYDDFTEKGVMQAATNFPNSSMEYMFVSASSEIINMNSCRVGIFFLKEETEVQEWTVLPREFSSCMSEGRNEF